MEYTREFDQSAKLVIKSDQEPAYVRVASRRINVPKYSISFGKFKLTGYDFLLSVTSALIVRFPCSSKEATGLFNESFDAIIDAFEH